MTPLRKPPRWSQWMLRRISPTLDKRSIVGDLEEDYHILAHNQGGLSATIWYFGQIILLLSTYLFQAVYWRLIMFKNYLKIAFRNIKRHKGYSFINIFGLTVGLAVAIITFLWVQNELNYDAYHEKSDRIFTVFQTIYLETGDITVENTYAPLGADLQERYPEIENRARMFKFAETVVKYGDNTFLETQGAGVDPSFLDIFTFQFIKGDAETALEQPHSVVLARKIADKYFGSKDPMGEVLRINQIDFAVTAVIEDIPHHSHFTQEFFIPFDALPDFGITDGLEDYSNANSYNYLLLNKESVYADVSRKIFDTFKIPDEDLTMDLKFFLIPLSQIHLRESQGVNRVLLLVILLAAFLVLMTACINFMNLSTARSINRIKEVGMRKVVGAQRRQLIRQFMSESFVQTTIAFLLAFLIVAGTLPAFNNMAQSHLSFNILNLGNIIGLIGILLFTALVAGSYPAFYLSSFQPVKIFHSGKKSGRKTGRLRKILVVVQFFFSILLIVCTIVFILQIRFMRTTDLGFEEKNIIYTRGDQWGESESVRHALSGNPDILYVTTSSQIPSAMASLTPSWGLENDFNKVVASQASVGYDYLETFGIELVAGRFYSRDQISDADASIVINERAVKQLGLDDPIGQQMYYQQQQFTIIGVVKNFYTIPIKMGLGPTILPLQSNNDRWIFFKIRGENPQETMKYIQSALNRFNPDYPVDLKFFEDFSFDEGQIMLLINKIMLFLTLLGIFISCLGLFGLASFSSEQRTKEIGIRKALGASISGVVVLLSKEHLKLLIIANILALPVGYLAMNSVLEFFAYRIGLAPWIFLSTGTAVFIVALMSVSYQAIKSARANPANSLRYE